MARDEHLLYSDTFRPAALRIYGWTPPTISLGCFQSYARVAELEGDARDLPVVRRATGGGAILHDREITYCLVVDDSIAIAHEAPAALYRFVHEVWCDVITADGLAAEMTPDHFPFPSPRSGPFFCFEKPGRTDLIVGDQKLLGSAQRRIPAASCSTVRCCWAAAMPCIPAWIWASRRRTACNAGSTRLSNGSPPLSTPRPSRAAGRRSKPTTSPSAGRNTHPTSGPAGGEFVAGALLPFQAQVHRAYNPRIMYEVYSGTRAGRPTVLLILLAVALAGALCLAWTQVSAGRRLGDPVRIENTPLTVRPPAGWVQDRDDPEVFKKPVRKQAWGQEIWVVERELRFHYQRWESFQPIGELLQQTAYRDVAAAYAPQPGKIGQLQGVQVRLQRVRPLGRRVESFESINRLVSTARGEEISVEYTPLSELTAGDMALFDEVCAAVQIEGVEFGVSPEELLARAGLELTLDPRWTVLPPDYPQVAGLCIQDNLVGDAHWAVEIYRTVLLPGRSAETLVQSFVDNELPAGLPLPAPTVTRRPDGVGVTTLEIPRFARQGLPVASYCVITASPAEAAVVLAFSSDTSSEPAGEVVQNIANGLTFKAAYPGRGLDTPIENGRRLARLLREDGPAAWWGLGVPDTYYLGEVRSQPQLIVTDVEALAGDPRWGYAGTDAIIRPARGEDARYAWKLDGRDGAYEYRVQRGMDRHGRPQSETLLESRAANAPIIIRPHANSDQAAARVKVGDNFVPPPLEILAQGWVAQQQGDERWLLEMSRMHGASTLVEILTPLEPDGEGRPRVLAQDDHWPHGTLLTFDGKLALMTQVGRGAKFERVTAGQAQEFLRSLGRGR